MRYFVRETYKRSSKKLNYEGFVTINRLCSRKEGINLEISVSKLMTGKFSQKRTVFCS